MYYVGVRVDVESVGVIDELGHSISSGVYAEAEGDEQTFVIINEVIDLVTNVCNAVTEVRVEQRN